MLEVVTKDISHELVRQSLVNVFVEATIVIEEIEQ